MLTYVSAILFILVFQVCSASPFEDKDSRIINGEQASLGQFPWQAALFFQNDTGSMWFCGGTIISEEWILTAAHCAYKASEVAVYTGIIDISKIIVTAQPSNTIIVHEGFVHSELLHDVALVRLSQRLTFTDLVHALALSSEHVEDGTAILVSGWGTIKGNDSLISPILNYVNLVTISNEECQREYGDTGLILPGMVCAATNPVTVQTPCHGDSGGPVVVDFDTDPRHVAIASFVSDEGCESGRPSGYTRTAVYLDWIKEKTGV